MAMILSLKDAESYFRCYLGLENSLVGVSLLKDIEMYEALNIEEYKGRLFYCQMVKKASKAFIGKGQLSNFSCDTSARVLGLKDYYEEEEGIQGWVDSGLYEDRDLARRQHETVRPIANKQDGLVVGALSKWLVKEEKGSSIYKQSMLDNSSTTLIEINMQQINPMIDIVMVPCNPYQAMRLLQAYTYSYGFKKDIKMSGQCGICFESTALVLSENDLSVSLLCSGTRFISQWPDDTLMVAFPFAFIENILKGLVETALEVESNIRKEAIMKRLKDVGLNELKKLDTQKAYYYRRS